MIIVTTPEYSALRDADTLDRELLRLGVKKRYVILNKVVAEMMRAGYMPRLREITSMLQPPLAGVIQYDENIQISMNLGVPIVLKKGFPQDVTHILWKAFSTAPQLLHYLYSLSVCSRIFNKLYCTSISIAVFCCVILFGIHIAIIFNDFSTFFNDAFFVFIIRVDFPIVAVVICT